MKEKYCITIAFTQDLIIDRLLNEELKINNLVFETEDLNQFRDLEYKFISAAHSIRKYIQEQEKK